MIFIRIRRFILRHVFNLGWVSLLASAFIYILVSWLGMVLAGEETLINPHVFFYWLVTTGSTVGYGDYSPSTDIGRWITLLWVIPFGLSLFVTLVTKMGIALSRFWKGGIMGIKALDLDDHILVIGWNELTSSRLLKLLVHEEQDRREPRKVALCVTDDITNPLPGQIEFVRVNSYTSPELASRTSLTKACSVIVDAEDDHETLAIALFVNSVNTNATLAVYFGDADMRPLLTGVCPNAEVIPPVSVEMLAKSASDPGSSNLQRELLDVTYKQTQYSVKIPERFQGKQVKDAFWVLKEEFDATLLGVGDLQGNDIDVNPPLDQYLPSEGLIYYVADDRLQQL